MRPKRERIRLSRNPDSALYKPMAVCSHVRMAISPRSGSRKMFVQPNLSIRINAIFDSLTQAEIHNMIRIVYDLGDDPGEMDMALAEELEFCEKRILADALHGRSLPR